MLRHPAKIDVLRIFSGGLRIAGAVTGDAQCKHTHSLELRPVISAAALEQRRSDHRSVVNWDQSYFGIHGQCKSKKGILGLYIDTNVHYYPNESQKLDGGGRE